MEKKIRLIDADALQNEFYNKCNGECYYCDYKVAGTKDRLYECNLINLAPTVLLLNNGRLIDGKED